MNINKSITKHIKEKAKKETYSFFEPKYQGMLTHLLKSDLHDEEAVDKVIEFAQTLNGKVKENFIDLMELEAKEIEAQKLLIKTIKEKLDKKEKLLQHEIRKISYDLNFDYKEVELLVDGIIEGRKRGMEYFD